MKYLSSFERFFNKANKTNTFGENASNFNVVRSIYCHRYLAFMKPCLSKKLLFVCPLNVSDVMKSTTTMHHL